MTIDGSSDADDAIPVGPAYVRRPLTKGPTMADSETPVLDLLARMTEDSVATSSLEPAGIMLARIAALVAVDAPPISYSTNLEAAMEVGIDAEVLRGVLAAIAPIVGTARIASATTNLVEALAVELETAMLAE
jgi:4-carboxymuconolactone decarboxylase